MRFIVTVCLLLGLLQLAGGYRNENDWPAASPASADSAGRECACTLENLWLDIVIAVDASESMGNIGLSELLGTLATALGGITIGQGMKHQTRVALVSYASTATVIAPLTQYTTFNALIAGLSGIEATNDAEVNLLEALQASDDLLSNRTYDDNRKAVFIIVASAYSAGQNDPRPLAVGLREAGHYIMTIAMVFDDEGGEQVAKLAEIASPGFAFSTTDDSVVDEIPSALCRANCFCPSTWTQTTNAFHAPTKWFGECVRLSSSPASWFGASLSCSKENAFLASELTKTKHDFLVAYFRNNHASVEYHIGLSWDAQSQQYFWQERSDGKYISLNISGYEAWVGGSENHSGQRYAVQVQHGGFFDYWVNVNSYS